MMPGQQPAQPAALPPPPYPGPGPGNNLGGAPPPPYPGGRGRGGGGPSNFSDGPPSGLFLFVDAYGTLVGSELSLFSS
jgi:hypothetical protein